MDMLMVLGRMSEPGNRLLKRILSLKTLYEKEAQNRGVNAREELHRTFLKMPKKGKPASLYVEPYPHLCV